MVFSSLPQLKINCPKLCWDNFFFRLNRYHLTIIFISTYQINDAILNVSLNLNNNKYLKRVMTITCAHTTWLGWRVIEIWTSQIFSANIRENIHEYWCLNTIFFSIAEIIYVALKQTMKYFTFIDQRPINDHKLIFSLIQ